MSLRDLFACCLIALPATAKSQSVVDWRAERLDLDVDVRPEVRTLRVAGVMVLRAEQAGAREFVLAFGANGVRFDSIMTSAPSLVRVTAMRDSAVVLLDKPEPAVRVRFVGSAVGDLERSPVRPEGAMVSWGVGWYPAVLSGSERQIEFVGSTAITVPSDWRTLSPGLLLDTVLAGPRRTERWRVRRPMARSFVAGPYLTSYETVGEAVVAVYLLPRHVARRAEYAAAIPPMVRALSSFFGPYPFDTFGIVELPRAVAPPGFGGRAEPGYFIAHTDALEGSETNVSLFAHELAHMWFPMAADSRPPGDDMMDEGIANYAVALYRELLQGRDSAQHELREASPDYSAHGYFHYARTGADHPLMADYGVAISRSKGPVVYDMLRRRIGDDAFFGVWRDLAARRSGVSLADFRAAVIARVPHDTLLPAFLSQWLDRTGAPVITVDRTGPTEFTLVQTGDIYDLNLDVRMMQSGAPRDTTLRVSTRSTRLFTTAGRLEIDPDDKLLLWKPRYGPPHTAPASWNSAEWAAWMEDEVRWLMRGYEVESVDATLVVNGNVRWSLSTRWPAAAHLAAVADLRRLLDDNKTLNEPDWRASASSVSMIATDSSGAGIVVTASGGWGGRQLSVHVGQRAALQYGWMRMPR